MEQQVIDVTSKQSPQTEIFRTLYKLDENDRFVREERANVATVEEALKAFREKFPDAIFVATYNCSKATELRCLVIDDLIHFQG